MKARRPSGAGRHSLYSNWRLTMRGILRSVVAAAVLLVPGASGVEAQVRVILGVGGGTVSPLSKSNWTGGSGSVVKSIGYNAQLIFGVQPAKGIWSVRPDRQYASLNHKTGASNSDSTDKLSGPSLDLVVLPGRPGTVVRPYILAGPSLYHDSYRSGTSVGDSSNTKVGFNGGAGLALGKSDKVWFFVEARYVYTKIFDTSHSFIPVTAGVRISTHQQYVKK